MGRDAVPGSREAPVPASLPRRGADPVVGGADESRGWLVTVLRGCEAEVSAAGMGSTADPRFEGAGAVVVVEDSAQGSQQIEAEPLAAGMSNELIDVTTYRVGSA